MPSYSYERLSTESTSFLERETPRIHGHTTSVLVFDPGPLAKPDGGVDYVAIRSAIEAHLHEAPRFRQKLAWIPFENHPVWVDDRDFRLNYHLRHSSLPRPGSLEQLENTVARIMVQPLNRSRPLWECWVLEGLHDGRFALLLKTHLSMIDDAVGADLLQAILAQNVDNPTPDPVPFVPRPRPSARELVMDEIIQQMRLPRQYFDRFLQLAGDFDRLRYEIRSGTRSLAALLGYSFRPPVETPFNGRIGPHRQSALFGLPLEDAREIATVLDGTVHDVILATVAAGVRGFLGSRLVSPAALDLRVSTPVSVDKGDDDTPERSSVVEWVVDLPVWEKSPRARFEMIRDRTRALRKADGALPARQIAAEKTWLSARTLCLGARALASHTPVNLTVTNVPGPQGPLYFEGARLLETFGTVPLRDGHGLGIAVMSYDGKIFWGLNGDVDLMPDLHHLARCLQEAFVELRDSATRLASVTPLDRFRDSSPPPLTGTKPS